MTLAKTDATLPVIDDFVGSELGSYEIVEMVGSGGMGTIFRARHTRIGRAVAIKLLRQDLVENKIEVERFLNEAKTVNRIGHPNIVDIYDFVEQWDHDPPLVYLVMELLEGCNLNDYLDDLGALPLTEAIDIAIHICDGLSAVHDIGVLHRDLKPDNVFLTDDVKVKGGRRIKLLDFGIARGFKEDQSSELTDPGRMVGTPQYMSPEQVLSRPLDLRSDIYSLGLVLYKMLSGATPFDAEEVGAVLVDQVHKPAPPAERPDGMPVPEDLQQVLARCLLKAPADRYQTARELRDALDGCKSALAAASREADAAAALVHEGDVLPRSRSRLFVGAAVALAALGVGAFLVLRNGDQAAPSTRAGAGSASGSAGAAAGSAAAGGAVAAKNAPGSAAKRPEPSETDASKTETKLAAKGEPAADGDAKSAARANSKASSSTSNKTSKKAVAAASARRARERAARTTRARRKAAARSKTSTPNKAKTPPTAKATTVAPAKTGGKRLKERINRGGTLDPFAN